MTIEPDYGWAVAERDDKLLEEMTRAIDPVAWAEHRMGMEGWDGRRSDSLISARAALAAYRKIEGDRIAALEAKNAQLIQDKITAEGACELLVQTERDMLARIAALEEGLRWYADQMCELGRNHECCGRMPDDDCAGCRARSLLGGSNG